MHTITPYAFRVRFGVRDCKPGFLGKKSHGPQV